MATEQRSGIRVTHAELLCKDVCGYYGNPAWQGFCTKCCPHNDAGSPFIFSKFEEKRNMEKGRRVNTMRRLFWGGLSPLKRPETSEGQVADLKDYHILEQGNITSFLKLLRNPSSQRLQSRCTAFLNTMEAFHDLPVQKQSELVQDFYQNIAVYFSSLFEAQVSQMIEHMENLIMTRLHKWVFCCDDEALSTSNSDPANADDFLSGLIYVDFLSGLIYPPRLHSNMQYVIHFGLPHSLMAGENGYYFTNLKLDGPALNLSREEFEGYMLGRHASSKRGSER
ncbi:unnamed protein product [Coregonus sp. 'balchen']|nr:unnamed protein product [Coregonus sp. 'balchen']